ncbi:MAG: YeeE/YedE family protein [Arenibacterium sp.]
MQMDWVMGLIGGALIGSAGALFLLGNGRIMGASGIIGGLVDGTGRSKAKESSVFLAALIGIPALLFLLAGPRETFATTNITLLVLGGLSVGVGTRLANGCTSGHGVCGISRLSLRGIVATLIYIGAGAATVLLFRQILGVI